MSPVAKSLQSSRELVLLSIVIPCHNEKSNVLVITQEISTALSDESFEYEIIFVDDSNDLRETHLALEQAVASDHRVRYIHLTRSFGQNTAIFVGLEASIGEAVIVMDCDLEDPPSAIPRLISEWRIGSDIVLVQRTRVGLKLSYRVFQQLYYFASRLMSEVPIPAGVGEFRLLDRKVVLTLREFPESVRFFRGLSLWPGYRTSLISLQRDQRRSGESQYNFLRAGSVAIDSLISFSFLPLRLIAITGVGFGVLAGVLTVVYFTWRVVDPGAFGRGWASIFLLVMFATGLNLFCLGVVAEYVGRIFNQVQNRPRYVIDHVKGFEVGRMVSKTLFS